MASNETVAFATRLTPAEAEQILQVIETTTHSRSDLLKRATRWYIQHNPDNIPAFETTEQSRGPLQELSILPADL